MRTRVALLAEGVDRNRQQLELDILAKRVALLAEGVDRNNAPKENEREWKQSPSSRRAWIEISWSRARVRARRSPSSRRAWIEIKALDAGVYRTQVALLAEGVDRNKTLFAMVGRGAGRPPRGGRG